LFGQAAIAQTEEPYDPCPPASIEQSGCFNLSPRYCANFNEACSEGFRLDTFNEIPVNQGIPGSGIVEDKVIYIDGAYIIAGSNIKFINCKFKMYGGSSILVQPYGATSTPVSIEFDHCDFFSGDSLNCGTTYWEGISVEPNPGHFSYSSMHQFNFHDCHVEDARVGLSLKAGPKEAYKIFDNVFRNNGIGIKNLPITQQPNNPASVFLGLNVVISGNEFYVDNYLLFPLAAPTGIQLVNVAATIGALNKQGQNYFHCLLWGILATNAVVTVNNCLFEDLVNNAGSYSYGKGIQATDGSIKVEACNFLGDADNFIEAGGADLTVLGSTFSTKLDSVVSPSVLRSPRIGIYSYDNKHGERLIIGSEGKGNLFNIGDDRWSEGIKVQRTAAPLLKMSCQIKYNEFAVSGSTVLVKCISVTDALTPAPDALRIAWNNFSVSATAPSAVTGISVSLSRSKNFIIDNNTFDYQLTQGNTADGFGIELIPTFGGLLSNANRVSTNDFTGSASLSHSCSIHCIQLTNTDFCENTVDGSVRGLHFKLSNDVSLRQNHIRYHEHGLLIESAPGSMVKSQIGIQEGRGNTWLTDSTACTKAAAEVFNGDALNSSFIIPEDNILPYLPPASKIIPDPNIVKWFIYDQTQAEDYCEEISFPRPPAFPPYEREETNGGSYLRGVPLWDLQRSIYGELLMDSTLRPASSPEETWFNAYATSNIAAFAGVEKGIVDALAFTTIDEQNLDAARDSIEAHWAGLDGLDVPEDFSTVFTLSAGYFTQRDSLLSELADRILDELSVESARDTMVIQGMEAALAADTSIAATLTQEIALQQLNEFRIRRLLGEPLTESAYEQMLDLAQQSDSTHGQAVHDVVQLLAPCDQALYLPMGCSESAHRAVSSAPQVSDQADRMRLSPNPSNGWVTVSFERPVVGVLRVFDALGREVAARQMSGQNAMVSIDLSRCAAGLYQVVAIDEHGQILASSSLALTR